MPFFLPSTLPLLPVPPPHLLYPSLTISIPISPTHLSAVLDAIAQNALAQKATGDAARTVAVVPVIEIERRIGRWATAAKIKGVEKKKGHDEFILVLEGIARIRLARSLPPVLSILPPLPLTTSTYALPVPSSSPTSPSLLTIARQLLPSQLHDRLAGVAPSVLPDLLVTILSIDWEHRVEILGLADVDQRSDRVISLLSELMVSRGQSPPSPSSQRPSMPAKSSALIRRPSPPTTSAPLPEDLLPLHNLLQTRTAELTSAALQTAQRELTRLTKIPPQSAEYGVGKTYIEWILALPWRRVSEVKEVDLEEARRRLESEHEGLEGVKKRIIEYLAVYRLKRQLFHESLERKPLPPTAQTVDPALASDLLELIPSAERKALNEPCTDDDQLSKDVYRDKAPILLLVGPPGVGKTSIARSLAAAMGRKFHRISLGGVRDEAEIRGHRRTYVGALPGRLVQGLRKVGVSNPLILLDELDKVGTSSFHGDPSAALLETLDPAQNWAFHDHYLGEIPLDLSQTLFIATANTLDTISPPLLDRCEVIECPGYVTDEKLKIARRFLLPKQIEENGLGAVRVEMAEDAMLKVITDYTREAGVRSLERELARVCRSKAVEFSRSREKGESYDPAVPLNSLEEILGVPRFEQEIREEMYRPGVVTGLAYQGSGQGGILLIESLLVPTASRAGQLVMTGSLGEVISESAKLALTWIKARMGDLGIDPDLLKNNDIHLHFPAGAVKKDGPSAGVGMILALVSLLTGRSMSSTIAVTGEITLRGAVTAVGGIKEKVLGANRAGITKCDLSDPLKARNRKDVQADLPDSLRKDVEMVYVEKIDEALEAVWGREVWNSSSPMAGRRIEARL